jgi:site-specific DNA recombinase
LPPARTCTVLTTLIERVEVRVDQVDIHLRRTGLTALFDIAVPSQSMLDEEPLILSVPARLRRTGTEISMLIDGTDPFAIVKPNARLIKLLVRAHRFNTTVVQSDGVAFAALAVREGVSRSYFTRVVRLSYLAPDITQAILEGCQPGDLTTEKLLAHSRLPLAWHDQRTALGFV